MAELKVLNDAGQQASTVQAPDALFAREYNEALVHQLVVAYQANARQGTRAQKDRTLVKHTTRKPWRQKGTGRARAGMSSSPLWRGGGRIFPNSPDENFSQKVNRKMYRAAMASILSELNRQGRLSVVESLEIDAPKTKTLIGKLKDLGTGRRPLLVTEDATENLYLSARNLPYVEVRDVQGLDPVTLVGADSVVFTADAVKKIEEWLA